MLKKVFRIIVLLLIVVLVMGISIVWYFDLWKYIGVIYRVKAHPEQAYEKGEFGRYSSWAWTPDNKIIYVKNVEGLSHTKGMGPYGYNVEYNKTLIEIINPDGTGKRTIKEISYMSGSGKWQKRVKELEEKYGRKEGEIPSFDLHQIANQDRSDGTLDRKYPDPALSHIGWIDWNKINNKLVFVANDGTGKTGIAVSDPEFKEVKWINCEGNRAKWSPDGKKIASIKNALVSKNGSSWYIAAGDIWIIDESNKEKQMTNGYNFDSLCWMPDGKRILVHNENDEYRGMGIVDIATGKMEKLGDGISPSISPDGRWVVCFDVDTKIIDINGNNKRTLYPYGGHFFPKWSPNGKKILMGWEGAVEVIDPDGNNFFVVTKGEEKK